ncbi:Beta-ketoacyl-[acyl-carrier-protein] synthase III B, chloroplastic [Orobanche minor]
MCDFWGADKRCEPTLVFYVGVCKTRSGEATTFSSTNANTHSTQKVVGNASCRGKHTLTDLAVEIAKRSLEMSKVNSDDVDLVLLCTSTPEVLFGSAPQIQKALGCKNNPLAYDVTAACSGFIFVLVSAACYIRVIFGGGFKNVLVIGADALSRYVDWTDRGSCILSRDAAGVVLVQACDSEEDGLFAFGMHSDDKGHRFFSSHVIFCFV